MLTKTNSKGQRISKIDNDILEIENNLNLEILKNKKLEEMKTEKRVDIVIREAPDELEYDHQIMDVEYEDEKAAEIIEQKKPRSGTEYIALHKNLKPGQKNSQGEKIPYVSRKVFARARANYAEQTRQMSEDIFARKLQTNKEF